MLIKNVFIAFLIFFSITVGAKNIWIVKNIQFKGLKNISQNEALKNVIFNIGSTVSDYDVQNSIHSLFKTGKFEDISVVFSEKTIIFNVKERPIISNIFISGNQIINNDIIKKYLKKINITKSTSFNEFFTNIFVKEIENFYHNLGRYNSHVKIFKNFYKKNNTVDLKILINEGIPVKVNNIKIFGLKDFSEEKILSLFKLKSNHSWWNFLNKSIYSPQALNRDLENLNKFYLNQGYFYFNLNNKKVDFIADKNYVNIILNINEGNKYKITNFFLNGKVFPYQNLIKDFIKINNNELYNKEKINLIINKITRFLSEKGYINAQVTVLPEVNHNKKEIILNFNINLNKRFFVKKIHFIGNELTQDAVLRRSIKQIEGEYFNLKLVELGKTLLEKTKFFSDVQIIKKISSNISNQVDIFYKVKEQPTGSINFGLGYGIDSGISFNTSFSQDNIFGSGNYLKASAIKNNNQKYTDISMRYPYFISNFINLNARFFYNDFKYQFNNISNLVKNTYGFESNLGFLFNDNNKINFGFGYTHNGIKNTEKKNNRTVLIKKIADKDFFNNNSLVNDFTINYTWIYDSLEYIYFPISGNQTYISGKNTIPGSDNNFYKITLDSQKYIPLNEDKKFIFLSHVHMGIGNSFNGSQFPFYENFYANNANSIRGFRTNTIGPKTQYHVQDLKNCIGYINNNTCESIDSIGGNATFITNLELITPIPFIENQYSKFLRTSFFVDSGNVWDTKQNDINNIYSLKSFENNILNNFYSSFGISLQWFSPIGPLVFSYALPIQKNKNYQLEAFQFNFGKNW